MSHPAPTRIRLEHVGVARARALLAGTPTNLTAVAGWPHADTLGALRMDAEHARTDDETAFLAILVDSGEVFGDAGWKGGPDASGSVEIGYGIAASVRGQGLGTELVALLTGWVAAQPGVRVITADVREENLPSRRALERCGFTVADVQPRADGRYVSYTRPA